MPDSYIRKNNRNGCLDIIKILATILILFHHYQQFINVRFTIINFWGGRFYLGNLVELFFLISGFLICNYIPKIEDGLSAKKFLLRRYFRLIPIVFLSTVMDLVIMVLSTPFSFRERIDLVFEAVFSSLGVFSVISGESSRANYSIWYINVLLYCYVLFYISFRLMKRVSNKSRFYQFVVPMFFMVLGMVILKFGIEIPFANEYIGRGLFAFFCGMIIGVVIDRIRLSDRWLLPITLPLLILSILPFCFSYLCESKPYIILVCYANILFLSNSQCLNRIFDKPVFELLANISFHAFCFHLPVRNLLMRFFIFDSFKLFVFSHGLISMILYMLIVYAISYLTYQTIEKPLIGVFRKKGVI